MTIKHQCIESCANENNIEKDRRRKVLLNDPNYGVVLCFLDKFRSILDLPNYLSQRFEDHLVNCEGKNSSRLIDFHFILLKRLSLARNAQRDKFDSIVTKFAARFDVNDSEHIKTTGYLKADVNIKIRIIKNLLESQFETKQMLKKCLIDKSAYELRSSPFGRDRFGVSYWLFMDKDCFVRLFREDIDVDRTWTNVATNRDELKSFIEILIADRAVRKKFPDWIIDYEQFSSVLTSDDFEQNYFPTSGSLTEEMQTVLTDDSDTDLPIKKTRRQSRASQNSLDMYKDFESMEENHNSGQQEESSIDDVCPSIRRSSRLRKPTTTIPQPSSAKKRRSTKSKTNLSNIRRKTKSRRHDYLYSSTSSSDEHVDYSSEDEYDSDDYLPNQSQIDFDNNLFQLEQEEVDEKTIEFRSAKTAQTSALITFCCTCSKNDQPEVLLICDGCNDAYHLECLHPVLLSVPQLEWFCPLCEHRKLSNSLLEKFKELLINLHQIEAKQKMRILKKSSLRKIKPKVYTSDESITESEHESSMNNDELAFQINDNTNLSSSCTTDDTTTTTYNISQRGRQRRIRFDMKNIFDSHDEFNIDSDTNDEYKNDINSETTKFNLQLPNKITRLIHRRHRSSIKNHKRTRTLTQDKSIDINEQLGSPLVYVNSDGNSHQIESFVTNSKQTSQIARRWNDVQRRSRLKVMNMKLLNEPIGPECVDENELFCPDDISLLNTNDSLSNSEIIHEETLMVHSNINSVESINVASIEKSSSKTILKKADASFDRLTRDIQCALAETNTFPSVTIAKATNQQAVKRTTKMHHLLYMTKVPYRSFPLSLFQSSCNGFNIFKTEEFSNSKSLSTIVQTSSSLLPLKDTNLDQTLPTMDT
ncbi:unnamed protein product [Rotaria magnacalcarata]|uniref:PHD-type domain-containing protein n=1 Tax=Rotaria magnacalcarata TaxID=392030 RepID=A0A816SEB0_9BILA|nr:unnamed protein product [Rotaria magnacalcarata]CAF2098882.1 unnamed protein product [Rotaria magnacalcarata]